MENNEIRQGATVVTVKGLIGTVTKSSWSAANGKSYTEIWITGATKNASRRILTANLTVIDNG
jgi:hypothetical protein